MSAEVELISTMGVKKSWNRPPIQMEFQVIHLPPIGGHTFFLLYFVYCNSELDMDSSRELKYTLFAYELCLDLQEI